MNGHNRGGAVGGNLHHGHPSEQGGHDNFSAMDVIDTSLRSGGSREKLNPKNQYDEEQVLFIVAQSQYGMLQFCVRPYYTDEQNKSCYLNYLNMLQIFLCFSISI